MPYDGASGMVYAETTVSVPPKRKRKPLRASMRPLKKSKPSPRSARPLSKMAMTRLLQNLDLLEAQTLEHVPTVIVEKIWSCICKRKLNTLETWRTFAEGCPDMHLQHDQRLQLDDDFQRSIRRMNSTSFSWLTHLKLQNVLLSSSDLVEITGLANLQSIQLVASTWANTGFSDRIMQRWAESARSDGCFSKLEAIFVSGHERVTDWSLQLLNDFPALSAFVVYFCGIKSTPRSWTQQMGWHDGPEWGLLGKLTERDTSHDSETSRADQAHYSSHRITSWTDVMAAYFSERNREKNGNRVRSVLNATLEERGGYLYPPGKFRHSRLHCFQRDWNFTPTHKPLPLPQAQELQAGNVSKKRKLKSGRALALDSILDRF